MNKAKNIEAKTQKQLKKAYKKELQKVVEYQVENQSGIVAYLVLYLRFIRDLRIAAGPLKTIKENNEVTGVEFDPLTKSIIEALDEFNKYEELAKKFAALKLIGTYGINCSGQEDAEKQIVTECAEHWKNFWDFFNKNAHVLEGTKNV